MRKLIIVDGTQLKTVHGGVLIATIAHDPNHHYYLIAFGVFDGDRNQSLIKAIREVYMLSQHVYCNIICLRI